MAVPNRRCYSSRADDSYTEELMNKDEITGKIEQIVGKAKQGVGEVVGSDKLANEGVAEQVTGAAKETWGNTKDAAKEIQDFRKEAASEKMDEKRGQISQAVTDAKEKAKEKIDEFKERHTA
jgi:uncharacterized protein YjbJ (UPF0337 family)